MYKIIFESNPQWARFPQKLFNLFSTNVYYVYFIFFLSDAKWVKFYDF